MTSSLERLLILLTATFTLTGCGLRHVVIPNLDWLVTRELNKTMNHSGETKDQLRKDIAKLLEQTKPQAKRVHEQLKTLSLKNANVFAESEALSKEYDIFIVKFAPILAKYMAKMDAKQIEAFKEYNKEKNKGIMDSLKTPGKKLIERYERFLGDLTEEQKKLLTWNLQPFVQITQQRLDRRLQYQKSIYKILENPDQAHRQREIEKLTLTYNRAYRGNPLRKKNQYLMIEVLKLSTPEQHEHFKETIADALPWLESFMAEDFT